MKYFYTIIIIYSCFILYAQALWADTPKTAMKNYLYAYSYEQKAQFMEASHYYEKILSVQGQNPEEKADIQNRYFINILKSGAIKKALKIAQTEKDLSKQSQQYAQLLLLAHAIKQNTWQRTRTAPALLNEGHWGKILQNYINVWGLVSQGNIEQALTLLQDDDDNPYYKEQKLFHLVSIHLLQKQYVQAENILTEHKKPLTLTHSLFQLYIRALAYQKKYDEAISIIDQRLSLDPDTPYYDLQYEKKLLQKNKAPQLWITNGAEGLSYSIYDLTTDLYKDFGQILLPYMQIALYLNPKHVRMYDDVASLYILLQNTKQASHYMKDISVHSPAYIKVRLLLSDHYQKNKQLEKSYQILQELYQQYPDDTQISFALSQYYNQQEKWQKSLKILNDMAKNIHENQPKNWLLYFRRAIAYERINQWEKAEKDFLQAIDLRPHDPSILNYLGYSWIDRNMHLDKAFDMLKKAVDKQPTSGFIQDSLGWAYFKLKRYDEALQPMEKAIYYEPMDPIITDHMGDVYWHLNRKREAYYMWNRALLFKPEEALKEKIQQKIKRGYTH